MDTEKKNGSTSNNAWSTAACYLFQPDSMLCGGGRNGVIPSSPAPKAYKDDNDNDWNPTLCGGGMNANSSSPFTVRNRNHRHQHDDPLEAAMKNLGRNEYRFRPHLCEDREFFVVNAGAMSVDVESLSTPSMGDNNISSSFDPSEASSKKMEAVREGAPGPAIKNVAQTQEPNDPIYDAPFPVLMYRNDHEAETMQKETTATHQFAAAGPYYHFEQGIRTMSSYRGAEELSRVTTPEWIVQSSRKKPLDNCPQHSWYPDEQRMKHLLAPTIGPETTAAEEVATGDVTKVFACIPLKSQQQDTGNATVNNQTPTPSSTDLMDTRTSNVNECLNNSAKDMELMKQFWTEKFTEAANKVIQSDSSRRIMEVIDPTIPRESDFHAHHHPQNGRQPHYLKGRQRYRKVLKKYRKHRLLVLILDPATKLYEMLELPYRPDETTVADVLIMARIQTTDDRLRYKEYVGLCRPNLDPPPPPPTATTTTTNPAQETPVTGTPPRRQLSPPPLNRVTKHLKQQRQQKKNVYEGREDIDDNSIVSDATAQRNLATSSMLQEVTVTEELVWKLLSPSRPTSSCMPQFAMSSLPYFTLPLLGDIVVTIPKGYTGEDVSTYAQTILRTPLFLRWIHRRYVNDLQRENDELLSRAKAMGSDANNSLVENDTAIAVTEEAPTMATRAN